MSTLFNTTQNAAMNDSSVTSGNADGWVVVPFDVRAPLPTKAEKKPAKRKTKKK